MAIVDFQALGQDILQVIEQHGLQVDNFGLSITLATARFDALFAQHPRLISGRMVEEGISVNGLQASIQILRRLEVRPDMIMRPPE